MQMRKLFLAGSSALAFSISGAMAENDSDILQAGDGNIAEITQTSASQATAYINQIAGLDGNTAEITQFGGASMVSEIDQNGSGNNATTAQQNGGGGFSSLLESTIDINQTGDDNSALVGQRNFGNSVIVNQTGSNDVVEIEQGVNSGLAPQGVTFESALLSGVSLNSSSANSSITVNQSGTGATISRAAQQGNLNNIDITQSADLDLAEVFQNGTDNSTIVVQTAGGVTGDIAEISQVGDGNDAFVYQEINTVNDVATIDQAGNDNMATINQ